MTTSRDKRTALKFLRKTLKRQGRVKMTITDRLRTYGAALEDLGAVDRQQIGRWRNNRVENSHRPFRRRERAIQRFRRLQGWQKSAFVHASVRNHFNSERSLTSRAIFKLTRAAALAEWSGLLAARPQDGVGDTETGSHLSGSSASHPCLGSPCRFGADFPRYSRCLQAHDSGRYAPRTVLWVDFRPRSQPPGLTGAVFGVFPDDGLFTGNFVESIWYRPGFPQIRPLVQMRYAKIPCWAVIFNFDQ